MTANDWNPEQYLKGAMGDLRTRPALDLLARIPTAQAMRIYDLGCGPGNSTAPLKARWPEARVIGIDNNPAMLARARAKFPDLEFCEGDINDWRPPTDADTGADADLIFSNACIQWAPDHEHLLPRLLAGLRPGGCLAIQQPNNFAAPSHGLIAAIARQDRYRPALEGALVGQHVREAGFYHDLLRPLTAVLDIWESEYMQALTGDDPVLEWVRGTSLLPVRLALADAEFEAFVDEYRRRLRRAYPEGADGVTLFPFRRMFLVAVRGA